MALAPRFLLVVSLLGVLLGSAACTPAPVLPAQAPTPLPQVAQPPTPVQIAPQPALAPPTQSDLTGDWVGKAEWSGLTFGITFTVAEGSDEVSDLQVTFTCPGSLKPDGNFTMPPSKIQDHAFTAFGTLGQFVSSSEAQGTFDNSMRIECGQAMVAMSGEWVATKAAAPSLASPAPTLASEPAAADEYQAVDPLELSFQLLGVETQGVVGADGKIETVAGQVDQLLCGGQAIELVSNRFDGNFLQTTLYGKIKIMFSPSLLASDFSVWLTPQQKDAIGKVCRPTVEGQVATAAPPVATPVPPAVTPVPSTSTPVPQVATQVSLGDSTGSAGAFSIGEASLRVASVELEPASQRSAAAGGLTEYNVLAVRASVLSGEPEAALGASVAVSDEAGNTQSSGFGYAAEDMVIWLFPVQRDGRQFRLHLPDGSTFDLPRPHVTLPPTAEPTATPPPSPTTPPDVTVKLDGLNLRDGPGTEFPSLQVLQQGDSLSILGKYGDCAWLNVIAPGGRGGWVSGESQYVTLTVPCDAIRQASYRPLTGQVKRLTYGYLARGWLQIENGTDADGLVILTDANRLPAIAAYIRAGETYKMKDIPDGVYSIYYAKGEGWDSQRLRFKTNETLRRFVDTITFTTTATTYQSWSVTLYGVPGGTAASEGVPEESFPMLGYTP